MFCRHVFGNISGRFCGISRFLGISQVRDRAKYQKPCLECGSFRIKGWTVSGEGRITEQGAQIQNHEDLHLVQGLTGTSDDATELERVLGMGWNSSKDTLCYQVKLNFSKKKRKINKLPDLTQEQISASILEALIKRMILSQGGCQKMGYMKHELLPEKTG